MSCARFVLKVDGVKTAAAFARAVIARRATPKMENVNVLPATLATIVEQPVQLDCTWNFIRRVGVPCKCHRSVCLALVRAVRRSAPVCRSTVRAITFRANACATLDTEARNAICCAKAESADSAARRTVAVIPAHATRQNID